MCSSFLKAESNNGVGETHNITEVQDMKNFLPERSCLILPLLAAVSTGRKSLYQEISGSGLPLAAQSIVAVRAFSTTLSWGPISIVGKPGGSWFSERKTNPIKSQWWENWRRVSHTPSTRQSRVRHNHVWIIGRRHFLYFGFWTVNSLLVHNKTVQMNSIQTSKYLVLNSSDWCSMFQQRLII